MNDKVYRGITVAGREVVHAELRRLERQTAPLPGRPGWRVDRRGHEWYSAAWLDEARERS